MKKSLIIIFIFWSGVAFSQQYSELLGRPTDSSISLSFLIDTNATVFWEYGTTPGSYNNTTAVYSVIKDTPLTVDLMPLQTNTKYFYRLQYKIAGTGAFASGNEHSFRTRRPTNSSFCFAIEADPHLDTNTIPAAYTLTLKNILSKNPDFLIDLGDIFMSEKLPVINQTEITNRHILYRSFFNEVCHSVPLYLTIGNHEGELGWMLNGTATSLPVMASNTRKYYYPNPEPNSFYSGNSIAEPFVGLRQNYFAWEWGDALFVVLDPYWYTVKKPGWGWTLGKEQYNWLKRSLENSTAKFKFIFCHQLVGGNGNDARGGTEYADLYENGGRNLDTSWGFDKNRSGWAEPIHVMMLKNNVDIYFHGHDHFYGKQDKDGIVYQEVPQPGAKNISIVSGTQPGYGYVNGVLLPSRGYLLVSVTPDSAKVDYIKTYLPNEENSSRHNGDIAFSYTIKKPVATIPHTYIFNGNGNWNIAANWVNNEIPPAVLPSGDTIVVDPVINGQCILNVTQVLQKNATLTVTDSKKFIVPGCLSIEEN